MEYALMDVGGNGAEELGAALKYVGDAEFADIYGGLGWSIDDVPVDEAVFQPKPWELVTDHLPGRDIWKPVGP